MAQTLEELIAPLPADQQVIVRAINLANKVDEQKIIDDLIDNVNLRNSRLFDLIYVDLSIDRSVSPLQITGAGTLLAAFQATDNIASLSVSFEFAEGDSNRRYELKRGRRIKVPYTKFYIYHSAQAGKYIKLLRARSLPSLTLGVEDDSGETSNSDLVTALGNSSTFVTGQVAVDTTATGIEIKAANTSRKRITIKIPSTAGSAVYIKAGSVTAADGHMLEPGDSITLNTTAQIKGITSAGSVTVTYLEE